MREIRCTNCKEWHTVENEKCSGCGQQVEEERKLEEAQRANQSFAINLPLIPIPKEANFLIKGLLWLIRIPQLIFYLIVYIVSYTVAGTAG